MQAYSRQFPYLSVVVRFIQLLCSMSKVDLGKNQSGICCLVLPVAPFNESGSGKEPNRTLLFCFFAVVENNFSRVQVSIMHVLLAPAQVQSCHMLCYDSNKPSLLLDFSLFMVILFSILCPILRGR
jgi:hypothetical protein